MKGILSIMPRSNKTMIHNLQVAINQNGGGPIMIDKIQFFSEEQHRPISLYRIKQPKTPTDDDKRKYATLFESPSQIQVVLFLRDYWYNMNNMEIPTDNEEWNEIKKKKGIVFG